MLIYIAGPLQAEKESIVIDNVTRAVNVGSVVFELGHEAFIPHLMYFSHRIIGWPLDGEQALKYCYRMVKRCDALIRLPGCSSAADNELTAMAKEDKSVIYLGNISQVEIERCVKVLENEING